MQNRALILVALLAGMSLRPGPSRADAQQQPPPPTGNVSAQLEAGALVFGTASGDHPAVPLFGIRGGYRLSPRFLVLGGYGLAPRSESAGTVEYSLLLHRLYARADLALGPPNRQFYLGAGPALFLESSSVTHATNSQSGLVASPGLVVALGLRLDFRRVTLGFEFGGEQRGDRRDFLVAALGGMRF